mmetsp:Transcript_52529/g.170654  ORF Transcript_52529/g.170654 Transcript_52529/m.170654 type:complete len:226 (+) Transcript_52529:202-879(+)
MSTCAQPACCGPQPLPADPARRLRLEACCSLFWDTSSASRIDRTSLRGSASPAAASPAASTADSKVAAAAATALAALAAWPSLRRQPPPADATEPIAAVAVTAAARCDGQVELEGCRRRSPWTPTAFDSASSMAAALAASPLGELGRLPLHSANQNWELALLSMLVGLRVHAGPSDSMLGSSGAVPLPVASLSAPRRTSISSSRASASPARGAGRSRTAAPAPPN